ncbi:MAG: hypothetical protein AB8B87_19995 [Granulosicoccus sp.]
MAVEQNIYRLLKTLMVSALSLVLVSCGGGSDDPQDPADVSNSEFCGVNELYDAVDEFCYADCTDLTDEQCDVLEQQLYGDLDNFLDGEFEGPSAGGTAGANEPVTIAQYLIRDDLSLELIDNQQPEQAQQFEDIWKSASRLLPRAIINADVSQYHVSTDGVGETLAFVRQDDNDIEKWIMAFDHQDYTDGMQSEFVHTTIHELGHIVFLENSEVDLQSTGACNTYSIAEGCPNPESVLNRFYQQFWTDIIEENKAAEAMSEAGDEGAALEAFYEQYKNRFVSAYAGTNPVEDLAEVFTYFVLSDRPAADSVANEKIGFLYGFPALIEIRRGIRSQIGGMGGS